MKLNEVYRKLLHVVALAIPFGIYYLPHRVALIALFLLAAGSVTVELVRKCSPGVNALFSCWLHRFLRVEEHSRFTGATYLFLGGFLCVLLYDRDVSFISLSYIILGDAAAALIGINFGRTRIGKKSIEGSLACAGICILFWLLFPRVPLTQGVAAAFLTAALELAPIPVNDNLLVPLVTGSLLQFWPF